MIRHYYTLFHIVRELQQYKNWIIVDVFIHEKSFYCVLEKQHLTKVLYCSLDNQYGTLYVLDDYNKAKKNTKPIFETLLGRRLVEIEIAPNDRVVCIHTDLSKIYFLLFTGPQKNVILTNLSDIIVESYLHNNGRIGEEITIIPPASKSLQSFSDDVSIGKALAECDLQLGKTYSNEVLTNLSVPLTHKISEINEQLLFNIFSNGLTLRQECLNSDKFFLLQNENGETILSLTLLSTYQTVIKEFSSISQAIHQRLITLFRKRKFEETKIRIVTYLTRKNNRLEKAIHEMQFQENKFTTIDVKKRKADLLMSQEDIHLKGIVNLKVTDWDGETIELELNPKHSLYENAEVLYKEIRRSRISAEIRKQRLPIYNAQLNENKAILNQVMNAETIKEIDEIVKKIGIHMNQESPKQENVNTKFRQFELSDGSILYVGRNAQNNDELTMRFAKPNDIWLHARGSAGSHAVLKSSDSSKPHKKVLEQAAQITAYYSQARNAKYTPVIYTKKKNVRKQKGAAVGAVVVEREEVIMVEPKLPVANQVQ